MMLSSFQDWFETVDIGIPKLYLVGGTVRDLLLNSPSKDLDIVCKNAKELAYSLSKSRNAAFVPMEKNPDEPCFRVIDRNDPDNFLDIAEMRGETIYDDLRRRDFTINSIAMEVNEDLSLGELVDPLHGLQDIQKKTIRMSSEDSIVSDPLRILRAVRISSELDFEIGNETIQEMRARSHKLSSIAVERIMIELFLILRLPRSFEAINLLDDTCILEKIFPEIMAMKGCMQSGYHHKDVWGHSLLVLGKTEQIINAPDDYFRSTTSLIKENLEPENRIPILKLAALLHDVGKPATAELHPDTGRIIFYNHDEEGAKLAGVMAERMKLSNRDREFFVRVIAEHLHPLYFFSQKTRAATMIKWFRKMKDDSVPEIMLSLADVLSSLGPDSDEEYRSGFSDWAGKSLLEYYESIKHKIERPNFVTGYDLIALGIEPGPAVGRVLAQIRNAQDTGEINSRDEAFQMAKAILSDCRNG